MAKKRNRRGGQRPRPAVRQTGAQPAAEQKKGKKSRLGRVLLQTALLAGGVALLTAGWAADNYLLLPFGFALLTLAVFGALDRQKNK